MIDHPDPITRLVRVCRPDEPLEPNDPRYVDCDQVRGANLVETLERAVRTADPERPLFKLFAGHRGIGKTSELLRLRFELQKPKGAETERPFVVFFDASELLDINDLDFPDLLVCMAAQVLTQLQNTRIPGFETGGVSLRRVWRDLKQALKTDVRFPKAEIGAAAFGSLTMEFRNRPNARERLREAIELHSTNLVEAFNDLLRTAGVKLRSAKKNACKGLLLIVDGLDKLERRTLPDGRGNTHDRLFIDRGERLTSLAAHTVYTVPISLIYSPRSAQLAQTFGEDPVPLPMIKLHDRRQSDVTPATEGMKMLMKILEKRCEQAGVRRFDVFDDEDTIHYLCRMTGGHPRRLMMFIQAAANAVPRLPITRQAAEQAVNNYANSLLREMPDAFWPKLKKFTSPQDDIPKDDHHQQMLLLLHVFEYMNHRPWYEVNPVLRELPKFQGK